MAERRLFGLTASPGLASGKVMVLDAEPTKLRAGGTPVEEARALHQAIAAALIDVKAVADRTPGEAAEMLAFQVEMLADDELAGAALYQISRGAGAHAAWTAAMAAEIEGYRNSDDAYFTARASYLQDIAERVLAHLGPGRPDGSPPAAAQPGAVVVAADLTLSRFLAIDWARGGAIVLTEGSPGGDVAMLARSRGVPMVVGVGGLPASFAGQEALVDGAAGAVVLDPGEAACAAYLVKRKTVAAETTRPAPWPEQPAITADGTRVAVHLNIADLSELAGVDPCVCDGIGLVRSECLFDQRADEQYQYEVYCRIADWAGARTVTIRTFDHGADWPPPYLIDAVEHLTPLGLRGIRLSLRYPEIFCIQLRALVRAARHGALRIVLPMIAVPEELAAASRLLDAVLTDLADAGVMASRPPLGMMVEVPAAAIAIDRFDADFFTIGSNDLTQYVTAAGRNIGPVANLADPANPAVLRLMAAIARHGRETGRDVSLCGDAGGDPAMIAHLLHAGVRSLSVAPPALAPAKRAIAAVDLRHRPA